MVWSELTWIISLVSFLFIVLSTIYKFRKERAKLKVNLHFFGITDDGNIRTDIFIYNTGKESMGIKEVSLKYSKGGEHSQFPLTRHFSLKGKNHINIKGDYNHAVEGIKGENIKVEIIISDFENNVYCKTYYVNFIHYENRKRTIGIIQKPDNKLKMIKNKKSKKENVLNWFKD